MKGLRIIFHRIIVDNQEYGSDTEYMVSRIYFSIINYNRIYKNLFADIKQPVGSNYETSPLEIGLPQGYKKPFNYSAFRDEAEKYYRSLMGKQGTAIHTGENTRVFLNGVVFEMEKEVEIKIENASSSW